jgi:hypothetical protein
MRQLAAQRKQQLLAQFAAQQKAFVGMVDNFEDEDEETAMDITATGHAQQQRKQLLQLEQSGVLLLLNVLFKCNVRFTYLH